ncbi:snoRNA-binding rRNA-processing protein NOP14 TDEL_0C02190 [Torulaspora delbrueckii]|uniref:Nop14-like family protein n=1 Tax=Torulaspora delbrueckii TaxID=4950 RepID=G8ZRG6_TORDE|nr:hypothetical protein TDEL_0C02190 [Torulaspora delbrueckii]CCE91108.1 hypothetical protein TDEL_0C02190 [Torulaspora delbrueckii]
MGGSQLKSLKAALKAHNLTGQTNGGKTKKGSKRKPKQYDREEREKVIANIREQFNPFEVKKVRNKHVDGSQNDNKAVGKPGISKQVGEEQRKRAFEAKMAYKTKRNGFLDKRFGERSKDLSEEDKMLERFTRERQSQSRGKNSLFDLNDDEDDEGADMFGGELTHLGEALKDDFDEGDLGLENGDRSPDNFKRPMFEDEQDALGESSEPARKKTKAEVMKEVIAKSKFYKHERQKAQEKLEDQIDELDENFEDVFSELRASIPKGSKTPDNKLIEETTDKAYDMKVRELTMDRRAVPSDRTKTEEELKTEAEEKKAQLEKQRLERMSGMLEVETGEEKGVEDLEDEFWANSDEEKADDIANSDDDVNLEGAASDEEEVDGKRILPRSVPCPEHHEDFLKFLQNYSLTEQPKQVRKIINAYQPKLAEGNNERLGKFTRVLLRHILFLSDQNYIKNVEEFAKVQNLLLNILKSLSEKYNQALSTECRNIISEMQERFKAKQYNVLMASDLVFFAVIGTIFSTSDQYHLVVTPSSILIAELLEQMKYDSMGKLAFGAILARISLQYQRISKRYVPELVYYYEKCLGSLLPKSKNDTLPQVKLDSDELHINHIENIIDAESSILHLHQVFDDNSDNDEFSTTVLLNVLESVDNTVSLIWKELPAFQEITLNIVTLLNELTTKCPKLQVTQRILEKTKRLESFSDHTPLTLQHHRPMSIPSHAPKFEENFNPDKKSYDPDKTRSEINKMKSLLKKERKFTMKEIRKDTKFEARQRITSQKESAGRYHSKMAHIINTISTEEGAEKNKYDREKRLRSGKK